MATKLSESGLLLTIPDAANLLGVWPARLKRAIRDNQLPAVMLGKQQMIPRAAIERLAQVSSESGKECEYTQRRRLGDKPGGAKESEETNAIHTTSTRRACLARSSSRNF